MFFYFSGHGGAVVNDYFYCGTTFDSTRPNETGMSQSELHQLFREASPNLLVKILDACESGTRLVKDAGSPPPFLEKGLNNIVQMASSLHDQASFGGDSLSKFTQSFCEAVARRDSGPIYYADIINTIRDDFLNDSAQTPYFIQQGTAREVFAEDASNLKQFRKTFETNWSKLGEDLSSSALDNEAPPEAPPRSLIEKLKLAEARMATPASARNFIDKLFDGVIAGIGDDAFPELFTQEIIEHRDFNEATTTDFIARNLANEPRRDRFVQASVKHERRNRSAWERAIDMFSDDPVEIVTLKLNCTMERLQLKITLTPTFQSLQRFVLILTCAPSLDTCYVFEVLTSHARSDWSSFLQEGEVVVRRWYKIGWEQDSASVIGKIRTGFVDAVENYIASVTAKLEPQR